MAKTIKQINSEFLEIQNDKFKSCYKIKDIFHFSFNEYKETEEWRIWIETVQFIDSPDYVAFYNLEEAENFLNDFKLILKNYYK